MLYTNFLLSTEKFGMLSEIEILDTLVYGDK